MPSHDPPSPRTLTHPAPDCATSETPQRSWLWVANWKMNLPPRFQSQPSSTLSHDTSASQSLNDLRQNLDSYIALTSQSLAPNTSCAICLPYPYLLLAQQALSCSPQLDQNIYLGGQDLSSHRRGSHTGEISAEMLSGLGCRYVLIGHSERRHGARGESPTLLATKMQRAYESGIEGILCVGESASSRDRGTWPDELSGSLRATLSNVLWLSQTQGRQDEESEHLGQKEGLIPTKHCIIAYEPVWAIGASAPPTSQHIGEAIKVIQNTLNDLGLVPASAGLLTPRKWLKDGSSDHRGGALCKSYYSLLYGGSINPGFVTSLKAVPGLSGGLVGRACLEPKSWGALLRHNLGHC